MSDLAVQTERASGRAQSQRPQQRRQVALPGGPKRRRGGLLVLGVLLVVGAATGFWYVLASVDERQTYVATARTIERWEIISVSDFTTVEANIGTATAMTPNQTVGLVGQWATGRIPAGTLVTPGLFETPPLSGSPEASRVPLEGTVLIQVGLPAGNAPFGQLGTGELIAMLGKEVSETDPDPPLSLIGILPLDYVEGGNAYYIVTPSEALTIQRLMERYAAASDQRIWKLNESVTAEDITAALEDRPEDSLDSPGDLGELLEPSESP